MNLARPVYGIFRTFKLKPENPASHRIQQRFIADDVSSRLASLIRPSKIVEANNLRLQLQEQGIQIPPKRIYRQAATLILHRPDYLERAKEFEAWLNLCPEAEHPDILAFSDVCTILLANATKNMSLLVIFGIQCTRKGYIRLVKERIMPVVEEFGSPEQRRELQAELDVATSGTQEPYDLEALVETALAEPEPITRRESPASYSVIEESLPAVLPEPREGDPNIFEDDSFYEYPSSYAPTSARPTPLTHLYSLIEDGMYDDAKRVLLEIQDLGISVPPSFIYEKAAQYALGLPTPIPSEAPKLSYTERLADFTMWFGLIPPFDPRAAKDFSQTRKLIFGAVITRLDILIQFGLILASKGYSEMFAAPIVLTVTQYTKPDVSMRFIQRFMKNNADYYRTAGRQDEYITKKTAYYIRGLAIRGLTSAGHYDEALIMLKEEPQSCSAYTLTYVIERLLRAGPKYDEERWWLQDIHDNRNPQPAPVNRALLSNILSSVDPQPVQRSEDDLPSRLRAIKRGLRNETNPPRSLFIMHFVQDYLELGRWKALGLLRRLAFRTGYGASARYVFATMLYNYHRGDHGKVIQEFCEAFYLTGVPRDEMILALDNTKRDPRSEEVPTEQWDARRGKLFPAPFHCSIAWHSLVALTPTIGRLEILYHKLVRFAQGHIEDQLPGLLPDYAQVAPLVPPPSWIGKVDPSAFTPFMRPLMHHSGATRGSRIIREMLELGMKPTVYHFTELAGFYAYSGEGKQAFFILEKMEAQFDKEASSKSEENAEQPPPPPPDTFAEANLNASPSASPGSEILIPSANVVLYTSLMRNFLSSRKLEAVEEINRRFRERFPYIPGRDGYLDRVYADWSYVLRQDSQTAKR